MSASTRDVQLTQVYRVDLRATPHEVWDAITRPEWTERHFHGSRADYDLRPGGASRGVCVVDGQEQTLVDGEVLEADPPRRLVQTWRVRYDPALTAEGFARLTRELEGDDAGGWWWVLSGLRTVLETGASLPAARGA